MLLAFFSLGHKTYEVDGRIYIAPPGPGSVDLPAVACMWASTYGPAPRSTVRSPDEDSKNAYVVCRIPEDGVGIPFHASHYSNIKGGFLVAAFLEPLTAPHPACHDPTAIVALVSDPERHLASVCEQRPLPARSDIAMMAPFDDDEGRPTSSMRIDIYRAE